ncbi:hypothetical protein HS125_00245 [bacterium]|nr:hypothetical protein [bacterium]
MTVVAVPQLFRVSAAVQLCLLVGFAFVNTRSQAQAMGPVPSVSPEAVERALAMILLSTDELRMKTGRLDDDPWRLPIVTRTFAAPVSLATEAQELCDALWSAERWSELVVHGARVLDMTGYRAGAVPPVSFNLKSAALPAHLQQALPPRCREAVETLLMYLHWAVPADMNVDLSASERRELADLLPRLLDRDTDNPAAADVAALLSDPALDRTTELLFKTNLQPYFDRARVLCRQLEHLPALAPLIAEPTGPAQVVRWCSPAGEVWIGTTGPDVFDCTAAPLLIFDPGGDDAYRLAGSASGTISLIVDLSGNDVYEGKAPFALAGACDGISMLLDFGGDDRYRADYDGLGAACLGVGLLYDAAGNDTYEGKSLVMGAALAGAGLLLDVAGNDRYLAQVYSQGFGGVAGFGALVDHTGMDLYQTGTEFGDTVGRTPPGYISMSQGCGFGIRQYASGGVGVLADRAGNDIYYGGYFCQGTSYWYALGILGDRGGDDVYVSVRYSQGAGIHLSNAVLWDQSGDDRYQTWGVGMGCGHDLAVGLFYDGGGNDSYTSEWLTLGGGNTNGIGIFYDAGGDDAYQIKNTLQSHDSSRLGRLLPAAAAAGLGFFSIWAAAGTCTAIRAATTRLANGDWRGIDE